MSVNGAFPYVPCPTLDQQYSQKVVGPTPFSSAKLANSSFESPSLTLARSTNSVGGGGANRPSKNVMGCNMSFPAGLRSISKKSSTIRESRSISNIFVRADGKDGSRRPGTAGSNNTSSGKSLAHPSTQVQVPNSVWEAPPQTFRKNHQSGALHEEQKLPRDTLHPLLSALQAGENAKSALSNPTVGYLANASRKGPPCDAHKQQVSTSGASPSGGGASFAVDGDDEDDDLALQVSRRAKQISHRGDLRTYAGRTFSAIGGFHDPDVYATTVVETAATQPQSLTALAAKALASALHDYPSHAIPANVTASVRQRPLPNSGPKGGNTNRNQWTGLHDIFNPVIPPPQAFRNLSSDVKEVLMVRERDCRHRLHKILADKHEVLQPPPCEAEEGMPIDVIPEGVASQRARDEASRKVSDVEKSRKKTEADPEDLDELADGELDPISALGGDGATLSLWLTAVRRCGAGSRIQPEDNIPMETHPAHATVLNKKLKVLTPQLISMHTSMSYSAQPDTRLSGTGIAMGDTQGQMKPPSASSFLGAKATIQVTQYSDLQTTPGNAFAFDSERFVTLLSDKGEEVEQLFLEGCTWLSNHAIAAIGRYCVNLRLLNLQDCPQLTDETLTEIADTCRRLAYLNVSGCVQLTGQPFASLLRNCTDLHTLCMSGLSQIDEEAELAFVSLRYVPKLSVLDISYCTNITDAVLAYAAQNCRTLRMVDLSGCSRLTDSAIASIGCSCSHLESLRLKICSQFTAQGLSRLTVAPRNLSSLDLGGLTQLTPKMLEEILKGAPRLRSLSISGCTLLDDSGVGHITAYCKSLKSLNISSCSGISMASCMELVHELIGLRWLIVSESSISNAEVVMLSALRESCRIIRNQFRPQPKPTYVAYFIPEAAKKKKPVDPKAAKGKK